MSQRVFSTKRTLKPQLTTRVFQQITDNYCCYVTQMSIKYEFIAISLVSFYCRTVPTLQLLGHVTIVRRRIELDAISRDISS